MMSELALLPSRRTVRRWDLAAAVSLAVFAALGLLTARHVGQLAELDAGLLRAADALEVTARAIGLIEQVPVVGDGAGQLAGSVRDTAADVRGSVTAAREDLRALAVVLGAVVVALPVVPLLLVYLPLRLARRRELRGLRRQLRGPADPMLVEHLARAALRRVPFRDLRRVSPQPWLDADRGRCLPLAAAELRRLGVAPPPGWSDPERLDG
jgi:predicted PurR-regulated permease PerM